jgi:hypothetical protein
VLPPAMGSFDCVRLSPHFAQDDRFFDACDGIGKCHREQSVALDDIDQGWWV